MKKLGFLIVVAAVLALAGCATGGGAAGDLEPFTVDLSTLPFVRNEEPLPRRWQTVVIPFPEFPVDVTQYQRLSVRAIYFDENGDEMTPADDLVMVVLIYDPEGDLAGPPDGPGPNTPVKEFNVGGFSGLISTDRGVRMRLNRAPGAIMFQNSNADVKYIEVTEITFHNGR